MTQRDEIAPLIPWYLNGTLDDARRADVERHLAGCASCQALLRQARGQRELAQLGPLERHAEHVRPELLARYVEDPGALEPETVAWIEGRLAECTDCAAALERLREVEAALAAPATRPERAEGLLQRLWSALSATVLRPAPALAYLLLLAALPVLWIARGPDRGPDGAPAGAPPRLLVESERVARSGDDRPAPPLVVPLPAGDTPVLLELRTDLTREDVEDLRLTLEISRDGETVWSEPRSPADFAFPRERAVLAVLLHPRRLGGGAHEIVLRARAPGDPLDRQALFRRSFVIGD